MQPERSFNQSSNNNEWNAHPPVEKPWQYNQAFGQQQQHWYPSDQWSGYRSPAARQPQPTPSYGFRPSPAPSPVHTPSGSPVLSRARGSSPSGRRMMPPVPPPKVCGSNVAAAGKPPRPRRPPLVRAKTVDPSPLDSLLDDPFQSSKPLDTESKIPSLDSLYEQLKAFASSSGGPVPPPPASPSGGRRLVVDTQLAADLAAAALEMVANSPLARSRSATFSSFSARTKVFHSVPYYF